MSVASVPTSQRAVVIHKTGGPSALEYSESYDAPKPEAVQANQILIKNVFAGINFIDTNVRKGAMPTNLPIISGVEGAGTVVTAGSEQFSSSHLAVRLATWVSASSHTQNTHWWTQINAYLSLTKTSPLKTSAEL